MQGYSADQPTGGVVGRTADGQSLETPVAGRRLALVGAMVALFGAALVGVYGGVAVAHPGGQHRQVGWVPTVSSRLGGEGALPVDLPEPAQNQTVLRQQGAVVPETSVGGVPGTVDEGLPDGSSWT